jgi:hypothetical protein
VLNTLLRFYALQWVRLLARAVAHDTTPRHVFIAAKYHYGVLHKRSYNYWLLSVDPYQAESRRQLFAKTLAE